MLLILINNISFGFAEERGFQRDNEGSCERLKSGLIKIYMIYPPRSVQVVLLRNIINYFDYRHL